MSVERKKVVQTELEPHEYETFLKVAKSKNMTIKDAVREAVRLWTASTHPTNDPLFGLKPVEFKVKVRSDDIEAFLYKRK